MPTILRRLGEFRPLPLDAVREVAFADRIDTKYLFPAAGVDGVLREVAAAYHVVEVGGKRISSYRTRYFDTRDFRLYRDHHGGRAGRQKVRIRSYPDTGGEFFEIKQKTGAGRTLKARVALEGPNADPDLSRLAGRLAISLGVPAESLIEAVSLGYERITLVDPPRGQRVTIDLLLTSERGGRRLFDPRIVVAEVKQESPGPSAFRQAMRARSIRPIELSKYCTSLARLEPVLKRNHFKPVLRRLELLSGSAGGIPATPTMLEL